MRKSKYRGTYDAYINKYKQAKKEGIVLQGVRPLTRKQWTNEIRQGMTNTSILNAQTMSRKAAKRAYQQYKKLMVNKRINSGEAAVEMENTYWGNNSLDKNSKVIYRELKYHRTFSGFMRDKHAIHMMISFEIKLGEKTRQQILNEYGY